MASASASCSFSSSIPAAPSFGLGKRKQEMIVSLRPQPRPLLIRSALDTKVSDMSVNGEPLALSLSMAFNYIIL